MAYRTRCDLCNRNFPSQDALNMHNSAKHSSPSEKRGGYLKYILIGMVAILLVGGIFYAMNSNGNSLNSNSVKENVEKSIVNNVVSQNPNFQTSQDSEVQRVNIGMNGNYYPNTIKVKAGVPVEITLDNSIRGCYRNFNIPDLGVSKSSRSPTDTINFTPKEKGTYHFRCSMGMGTGTLIVE